MDPFLLFFKYIFQAGVWVVTGIIAVFMTVGGRFEAQPRDPKAPTAVAVVTPSENEGPTLLEIRLSTGERFRGNLDPEAETAPQPPDDVLEVMGPVEGDRVSTFVELFSDRGRGMICRLSFDPSTETPGGTCAVGTELVYDLHFIEAEHSDGVMDR